MSKSTSQNYKEKSKQMFNEASKVIPGGVTANIKYFSPHPIFMKRGKGSKLIDVDNREYIDYSLCYGALITGHGHPKISEVVTNQLASFGTAIFGTPHELEINMAEKLIELYPSVEQVRYTNSGLEATLFAIRLATAHTGKQKIAKFEGHYHGGYNEVLISVNPNKTEAGNKDTPKSVSESKGISKEELENTIILPFNDIQATEKLLRTYARELAAVILEPVQGGFIPADQTFIQQLRKLTEELNILLIFDEVKTGFRVALGGAQSVYQVKPDLTALGKVLGGGFPIGAVGGKKEIMMLSATSAEDDVFSIGTQNKRKEDTVFHSGTYNGHPIILAAGLEAIRLLEHNKTMEELFHHTMLLRTKLEKLYKAYDIQMKTIGLGSIFNIVLTDRQIRTYRDMWNTDIATRQAIDTELLNQGIYIKPLNRYSLSTVHTIDDIEKTVVAHEIAIRKVMNTQARNYSFAN
ncbi:aspartate aminotransferase family protein [Virgibacillus sp. W0430]|uniref:aspartate aminotransferase family protein n=1 Tax=Virgibacillus sp. W0430 TaxID=3391580 RepID=UPI003F47B223